MRSPKPTNPKMEQLHESLQWWKTLQVLVPVIIAIITAFFIYYSQTKINEFDKTFRQIEQTEKLEEKEKKRLEGKKLHSLGLSPRK